MDKLYQVEVESGNAVYASVGGKCIIGKSDNSKEDYDILVFMARDTIEATICGTIKIIGSYAFSGTKLASIEIPSHVTQICKRAFLFCEQLQIVEIEGNSVDESIYKDPFDASKIIMLPSRNDLH